MIDYIAWANEYEEQAQKILHKIEKLKKQKENKTLSLDDKHNIDVRVIRLTNLYHEHKLAVKQLRERGNTKCLKNI